MHGLDSPFARAFPILVTVGVVFALVRVALTAATTHTNAGPVLFTTPDFTLPTILGGFTVGGPIERAGRASRPPPRRSWSSG